MIRKELHEGTMFIYRLYVVRYAEYTKKNERNVYMKYLSNYNNLVTPFYL